MELPVTQVWVEADEGGERPAMLRVRCGGSHGDPVFECEVIPIETEIPGQ